jgi:hypothetical protein
VDSVRLKGVVEEKGEGKEHTCMRIHPLIKVFPMGEEVGNGVRVSRDVFQDEIKVLEELHPPGLVASDFLWLAEELKVFMVSSDGDGVVGIQEIGAATLKAVNNGGHLLIMNIIVPFSW